MWGSYLFKMSLWKRVETWKIFDYKWDTVSNPKYQYIGEYLASDLCFLLDCQCFQLIFKQLFIVLRYGYLKAILYSVKSVFGVCCRRIQKSREMCSLGKLLIDED